MKKTLLLAILLGTLVAILLAIPAMADDPPAGGVAGDAGQQTDYSTAGATSPVNPQGGPIAIVPLSPILVGNCIPFGNNTSFQFTGFIYRDVAPFDVVPGDTFSFDLGALNDINIQRNIYFGNANINPVPGVLVGSDVVSQGVSALGWTQVASDTQVPANPLGDLVVGNYELTYTVEAPFVFSGGGLLVGFGGSPPGAYADPTCDGVLVNTNTNDAEPRFYARFFNQPDQSLGVLDVAGGGTGVALGGIVINSKGQGEPRLDHFKCYRTNGSAVGAQVGLLDQFVAEPAKVFLAIRFCNPAEKFHLGTITPIKNPDHHLKLYFIKVQQPHPTRVVEVSNQFGTAQLTVNQPLLLAVPTQKLPHDRPVGLDHYKCYRVNGPVVGVSVGLNDQFTQDPNFLVHSPVLLCNPVEKRHQPLVFPIQNPVDHLVCYIGRASTPPFTATAGTNDQFIGEDMVLSDPDILCVPSEKKLLPPPPPPDKPDLSVRLVNPPVRVDCLLGGQGTCTHFVDLEVLNLSAVDVLVPVEVHVFTDNGLLAVLFAPPLLGGSVVPMTAVLGPGDNCYNPNCTVTARVDPLDAIMETDETNNEDTRTDFGWDQRLRAL